MIEAKRELTDSYRLAKQRIDLANAIDGGLKVRAAAIANSAHPEVEVERRNIMGVVVPSVSGTNLKSTFQERGVGYIGSSPYIDEASDSFSELIEKIVTASEMEATLKRLLEEIEATKRRVNALEFKVIPELEEAKVLNIPIVAIIDSNSNPDGIDFPIPGNDDATRALKTFCELISDTISIASKNNITKQTSDIGETDILAEDLKGLDDTSVLNNDKKEEI